MPKLRLKLDAATTDDWLANISTKSPDAIFNVLTTIPAGEGLLGIVEVQHCDKETLCRHFDAAPQVTSYEVLHDDDRIVLLRGESRMTESYDVLLTSGTVPQYPVILQDGWFSAELLGSQKGLSAYLDAVSAVDIPYEIVSLSHEYDPGELLTERQWQAITEAVDRGYYETSRRCTLVELAETFGINKSSMSKLLHRAEIRIIREFVAEAARQPTSPP